MLHAKMTSAKAKPTRSLRGAVRKGVRRAAVQPSRTLSASAAANFADALDKRWVRVPAGTPTLPVSCAKSGEEAALGQALHALHREFMDTGRTYAAMAVSAALRNLKKGRQDVTESVHPALWAHIRRIENEKRL